jgi:hypothetical protein
MCKVWKENQSKLKGGTFVLPLSFNWKKSFRIFKPFILGWSLNWTFYEMNELGIFHLYVERKGDFLGIRNGCLYGLHSCRLMACLYSDDLNVCACCKKFTPELQNYQHMTRSKKYLQMAWTPKKLCTNNWNSKNYLQTWQMVGTFSKVNEVHRLQNAHYFHKAW